MRLKQEHYEKSTLDRKLKRLKNVDSIKGVFIFALRSQKSIFPDCPFAPAVQSLWTPERKRLHMEDKEIVRLYWDRNELAIQETSAKYGKYCYRIAYNILFNKEDADESVNDTWLKTWEAIPPHFPEMLSAFVGKITRRISLNKWHSRTRKKRGGGQVELALEELDECVAFEKNVEQTIEYKELLQLLNTFLGILPETERDLFVCRYWFMASIKELSERFAFSESKTKSMLFRIREKLKIYLEEEGYL